MKKFKRFLPNLITLTNLILGIISILFCVNIKNNNLESTEMLIYSSLLILIAALTDRLDGKIARALGVTSELGKQLDSLSDLISFGVAPIIVSWKICLFDYSFLGYILAIMFPIAGAYRLARFNVSIFNDTFTGVPITVAGAFLSIYNIFNCISILKYNFSTTKSIITLFIIAILSFLMVSKFKIKKV